MSWGRGGGLFLGHLEAGALDLDAYFARIGFDGPKSVSRGFLEEILRLQAAAIAFEGIDPFLGRPVDLSDRAIDAKLLHGGRGGYCFEQNTLLLRALRTSGFSAWPLIARSRWQRPATETVVRTHMVVGLELDGCPWIADLGFGSCLVAAPLRLNVPGESQSTRDEPARVVPVGREWRVERLLDGIWTPLFDLVPEPQTMTDMAAANWLISTHPASSFRNRLVAARVRHDVRHALVDGKLVVRHRDGRVDRCELPVGQVEERLRVDFGLSLPRHLVAELERRLDPPGDGADEPSRGGGLDVAVRSASGRAPEGSRGISGVGDRVEAKRTAAGRSRGN